MNTPMHPDIRVEDDPSPAVLMMANWLRLALSVPTSTRLATGIFAVTSPRGPSVTVNMRPHIISLESGMSDEARLFFRLDFNHLGDSSHKPVIDGDGKNTDTIRAYIKHPWLTARIRRLLVLPFPHWQEGAARFWTVAATLPDMPKSLLVTCNDEAQKMTLGEGEPEAKITGISLALARLFAGHTILSQESYIGRLHCQVSLQHLAGLSNAGLELRLGDHQGSQIENLLQSSTGI